MKRIRSLFTVFCCLFTFAFLQGCSEEDSDYLKIVRSYAAIQTSFASLEASGESGALLLNRIEDAEAFFSLIDTPYAQIAGAPDPEKLNLEKASVICVWTRYGFDVNRCVVCRTDEKEMTIRIPYSPIMPADASAYYTVQVIEVMPRLQDGTMIRIIEE